MLEMADYKQMYLTLLDATEKAMAILIEAQQKCEELYIDGDEKCEGPVLEVLRFHNQEKRE